MQVNANHLLDGVDFVRSPNVSGMMNPTGVIKHYTAGYTGKSAIVTLTNPAAKVSAHLVIDRDGKITQLVPFNRIAWHAGPSALDGISGCNNFCIGFEYVNPGYFKIGPHGEVIDAYGHTLTENEKKGFDLTLRAANARIGGGTFIWPAYTDAQIIAGIEAFKAIIAKYKITHLAGHEEIDTRKWKTDPGPAFPMGRFKALLHGPSDRSDGAVRMTSKFLVNMPKLNVRSAPNATASVITVLSGGSEVVVIKDEGAWSLVEYAPGKQGYVSDQYLKKE